MEFTQLAAASSAVAATRSRIGKIALLAEALRQLGEDEIETGVAYLSGRARQRRTGVGWASLLDLPPPAQAPTLSVADVDRALAAIAEVSGTGSQTRRRELLHRLFAAATEQEQVLLRGLLTGELRQGAAAGLLVDAVAHAAGVPLEAVRRALLVTGDLGTVARTALTEGASGLAGFSLRPGTPLSPMLAASASDPAEALATAGAPALVDTKLDGVRIQVHRDGDAVAVFSRSLDVLTTRMPGVVAAVRALPVRQVVLDGEAVLVDADGRPRPFQETAGFVATRTRLSSGPTDVRAADRTRDTGGLAAGILAPFFFDLLYLDGADLLDAPLADRVAALARVVPEHMRVASVVADTPQQVAAALEQAVAAGQEGVVVKSLAASYQAGRRGSAWVKLKPRHTLDLVVLAAEWGHGRRRGFLSNLHLGARDPATGGFVMLGKTFKGLTDEMLRWQTDRLLSLATERGDWVVRVRPELVVEIAFDGVQTSSRYPGGVTLRFARVVRYRNDKTADQADTIDQVRALHRR